jgi:hypothetical protein
MCNLFCSELAFEKQAGTKGKASGITEVLKGETFRGEHVINSRYGVFAFYCLKNV